MKTTKKILSLMLCALLLLSTAAGAVCAIDGEAGAPTIRSTLDDKEITLEYKQSKTFDFVAENVPENATVHVFVNGEDKGESTSYTVEKATEDYTVEGKILDKDGGVLAVSGEIKVTVKNTFADRLKDAFRNTFGRAFDALGDVFGAIFMRIWVWLHQL